MSQPDFLKAGQMTHELDTHVAHAETMRGNKCGPQRKLSCSAPRVRCHVVERTVCQQSVKKGKGQMLCLREG